MRFVIVENLDYSGFNNIITGRQSSKILNYCLQILPVLNI